jgi:hypothetical protein
MLVNLIRKLRVFTDLLLDDPILTAKDLQSRS